MPGTWKPLVHQPSFPPGTMLLLTDGTVLCQHSRTNQWWRLTPDAHGSYLDGTWTTFANSPHAPTYYASAVLRDGRVFVAGGEDDGGSNGVDLDLAWIFDPQADSWASIPTPGWGKVGDAASCMLPDGRILLGSIQDARCAIYDPVANSWSPAAAKQNTSTSEETWTLLPDETVLTCECAGAPQTEKYVIAADQWVRCGSTPQNLVETSSIEIGPALLLPDGRLFAIGATGETALYTMPPVANQAGTWAAGPAFPPRSGKPLGAKDAPAVLMPNGRVLCAAGPVDGVADDYLGPTYFFEFDPWTNLLKPASTALKPGNGGGSPYEGRMLLLPNGQVAFGSEAVNEIWLYTHRGRPHPAWKPAITACPHHLKPGHTYTLTGRQLNGLSQANSYGDDAQMATNYPLVRIEHRAHRHIHYCRTFNHSTMGVNTGTVLHSTSFTVPPGVHKGPSRLQVVTNGIASQPFEVSVGP
jgi:Kelch motif